MKVLIGSFRSQQSFFDKVKTQTFSSSFVKDDKRLKEFWPFLLGLVVAEASSLSSHTRDEEALKTILIVLSLEMGEFSGSDPSPTGIS